MALWRQVLAALNDTLGDTEHEEILACGAAQLTVRRAPDDQQPTPDDMVARAFSEFALLLDADQARAALRKMGRGRGWPGGPDGVEASATTTIRLTPVIGVPLKSPCPMPGTTSSPAGEYRPLRSGNGP
ncbi:hypothetical protein ACIP93_30880 [Streptomyces sp. NPDC088745]|uniref:hypothetical protein n=1 Tax=Streptomyces sp. NPDC088745 TaxID=3365884 RepID=UPI00380D5BA0